MTLPGFRTFIAERAQSRVYAFLSAYLTSGADMHGYNTRVPEPADAQTSQHEDHGFYSQTRFSLVSAMTALMALGSSLETLVPTVATHAACMLGLEGELGTFVGETCTDLVLLDDKPTARSPLSAPP